MTGGPEDSPLRQANGWTAGNTWCGRKPATKRVIGPRTSLSAPAYTRLLPPEKFGPFPRRIHHKPHTPPSAREIRTTYRGHLI